MCTTARASLCTVVHTYSMTRACILVRARWCATWTRFALCSVITRRAILTVLSSFVHWAALVERCWGGSATKERCKKCSPRMLGTYCLLVMRTTLLTLHLQLIVLVSWFFLAVTICAATLCTFTITDTTVTSLALIPWICADARMRRWILAA